MHAFTPMPHWQQQDPTALVERVEQAGIQGMGGGGFNTAQKLRLARQAQVTRIIANGVECEPGIAVDAMLLAEHSSEVAQGLRIAMAAVGANYGVLAFAADFPTATLAAIHKQFGLNTDTQPHIECTAIQRTPGAGAERGLCQQLFNLTLSPAQYPIERGVLCLNVGTLFAIQQAVELGTPLQQRLVTVNGATRWVALGTTLASLLDDLLDDAIDNAEHAQTNATHRYRVGGHYTGKLSNPQTQVSASTNAVWLVDSTAASPCTYCGRCADLCPEALAPQELLRLCQDSSAQAATQVQAQGLSRCTECGLCNNTCPSNIDLVGSFQQAKAEATARHADAAFANRAKQRHERHLVRAQARVQSALERREDRREARRAKQRGPDAWR